jgi:hypothetical protein
LSPILLPRVVLDALCHRSTYSVNPAVSSPPPFYAPVGFHRSTSPRIR